MTTRIAGGGDDRHQQGRADLSRFTIDLAIRVALIAGVVWVSLVLLRPIMPLMAWAVILAITAHPAYAVLRGRPRLPRGLAATLVSLVLLAFLLVPVVILAISAIDTLEGYAGFLAEGGHLLPPPPESIREWPLIGQRLHDLWANAKEDVRPLLTGHVAQIASVSRWIGRIAAGATLEILQFAAAVIVAGVLFACAETLTGVVRDLADRVADARGRRFLDITGSTIRNVSQGVIGVALLQSALLGIGMLVAGAPFAGALAFACLVLAIVQVGPNIVMIPVIIWAWFSLPTLTAAVLTAHTAPLLLVDNVLRPVLMARGLQTPMVVILAGVICGTLAGGLIGLFIGPVVLAVFYELVTARIVAGRQATETP